MQKPFPSQIKILWKKAKEIHNLQQNSTWFRQDRITGNCLSQYNKKGFQRKRKPFLIGWEHTGSNRGPSACKADALNQLSYAPIFSWECKDKR